MEIWSWHEYAITSGWYGEVRSGPQNILELKLAALKLTTGGVILSAAIDFDSEQFD